jgi:enamine deaminase RidA (YjgF/YER057c/UK114 family)
MQTAIINTISGLLEEAGTSWDLALKTTIFLADMGDFQAMNAVYSKLLPDPKPARTTIQAGKLPGNFLIEIEAVVARPHC